MSLEGTYSGGLHHVALYDSDHLLLCETLQNGLASQDLGGKLLLVGGYLIAGDGLGRGRGLGLGLWMTVEDIEGDVYLEGQRSLAGRGGGRRLGLVSCLGGISAYNSIGHH